MSSPDIKINIPSPEPANGLPPVSPIEIFPGQADESSDARNDKLLKAQQESFVAFQGLLTQISTEPHPRFRGKK